VRIKAGTLSVDITADGKSLETTLKRSDSLTEAFATQVDRRMKRVGTSLKSVGTAAGLTDKELASLEKRMHEGLAADSASRALEQLRRYAGLSASEYRNLATQMGVTTRVSEKAGTSLGALAKQAAVATAAYMSLRTAASLVSQTFADFRDYQSALVDMPKVTDQDLGTIDAAIKAMPRELGDPTSLLKGYYQTISAGVTDTTAAMDLLTTASKAAKAAHVSQEETIKGLTKTLAGFDGEIRNAAEASDLLFKIEKLGQTSFAELVPVVGDIAAATHLVGVKSQEMAAGLSLITQTAGSTAEAATKWRGIMIGLYKPTENLQKVLKALGYQSGQAMVQYLGLAGTLQTLQAVADKSGFSLGKLFEDSEALTGIAALSAQQWGRYATILDDVRTGTDATNQAFDRWKVSAQGVKDTYDATLKQVAIEFGSDLAPMMTQAMKEFQDELTRPEGRAALESLAVGAATLGQNLLQSAVPGLTATVNALNDIIAAWNKIPAPLQGVLVGGGVGALLSKGNPWVTGVAALGGMAVFGDAANDRSVAEGMARGRKESQTQAFLHGDNGGTIPDLQTMFPDLAPQVQQVKKQIDGMKVSIKEGGKSAADAAARYGEQAASSLQQAEDQYDQLVAQLGGDTLGSKIASIDKKYNQMESSIRKSMIGTKGATADAKAALEQLEKNRALEKLIAESNAWKKAMQDAGSMLGKIGQMTGDPTALYASKMVSAQLWQAEQQTRINNIADPAERAKQQAELMRAAALDEADARKSSYENSKAFSSVYWNAERERIQNHLEAVKGAADDETAYKIYAAQQWDEYNKALLEKEIAYAGSFATTFTAKWGLAFGSYKSDITKSHEEWGQMSDAIVTLTQGAISSVSGGFGDFFRKMRTDTVTAADLFDYMCSRMYDAVANFVEKTINDQLSRLAQSLGGSVGGWLGNIFGIGSSTSYSASSVTSAMASTGISPWTAANAYASGAAFPGGTSLPLGTIIDKPTFFSTPDTGYHAYAAGGVLNNVAGEKGPEVLFPLTSMGGKQGILGRLDTSGSSAQQTIPNISITLENRSGQEMKATKGKTVSNQDGLFVTYFLDLVARNSNNLRLGMQGLLGA